MDKNESKMDERLEVCQNSSIDDFMRGLEIYKVVHTERGAVEFIINDHRHGVPKGAVELGKKHASEYKKKMEVDMKKEFEEKLVERLRDGMRRRWKPRRRSGMLKSKRPWKQRRLSGERNSKRPVLGVRKKSMQSCRRWLARKRLRML